MPLHLTKVRQQFEGRALQRPVSVLHEQLSRFDGLVRPHTSVAIAVGSRGIDTLAEIVSEVVTYLRTRGALPFIVPAMGSHGGATATGQADVLDGYGIRDETVGAPVRATMEVCPLESGDLPIDLFMDRNAFESDGVILVNRIKPHTDFHGRYESGLMKMALIGLGKREGASAVHRFGVAGLRDLIEPGARKVIASGRILGGIGLVEDAYHKTMAVKALRAHEIADEEPALLELARANMPRLPVKSIDVLIIDRMGKDISGVGIDPNITGRIGVDGEHDPAAPRLGAMVVCDLTPKSHGNAIGVGLADVITQRLSDKIDRRATYENVITSGFLERGKIPLVAKSDIEAFEIALRASAAASYERARIVRISDTLHLSELYVSSALLGELSGVSTVDMVQADVRQFDEAGMLTTF